VILENWDLEARKIGRRNMNVVDGSPSKPDGRPLKVLSPSFLPALARRRWTRGHAAGSGKESCGLETSSS
jgi:hypothetical protein